MTEPSEDDTNNPHPGPRDEGGHGGMATREHDAHQDDAHADGGQDGDGRG